MRGTVPRGVLLRLRLRLDGLSQVCSPSRSIRLRVHDLCTFLCVSYSSVGRSLKNTISVKRCVQASEFRGDVLTAGSTAALEPREDLWPMRTVPSNPPRGSHWSGSCMSPDPGQGPPLQPHPWFSPHAACTGAKAQPPGCRPVTPPQPCTLLGLGVWASLDTLATGPYPGPPSHECGFGPQALGRERR